MSFRSVRAPDPMHTPITLVELRPRGGVNLGKAYGEQSYGFPGNARITFTATDLAAGVGELLSYDYGSNACAYLQSVVGASTDAVLQTLRRYLERTLNAVMNGIGGFPKEAYKACAEKKLSQCSEAVEYTVRSVNKMFNVEGGFSVGGAVTVLADIAVSVSVGQIVSRMLDQLIQFAGDLVDRITNVLSEAVCGAPAPGGTPIDSGAPPTVEPGTLPGAPGPGTLPPSGGGGGGQPPPSAGAPLAVKKRSTMLGLSKRTWSWVGLGVVGTAAYYTFAKGSIGVLAPVERGIDRLIARVR
jgi:hypothetical protein